MHCELFVELEQRVKTYLSGYDSSHDFSHIQRVVSNAKQISQQEMISNPSIDEKLILVSALVHDVGDFKYCKDATIQKEHLKEVLKGLLDEQESQIVIDIVTNMSFRKELEQVKTGIQDTIEFKVVQDADRLDAIGAIGLARCFVYSGATGRPIVHSEATSVETGSLFDFYKKAELTAEQYNQSTIKNEGDSIGHVFEKLLTLKDRMKTEGGKKIAQQRHDFMLSFLKQLDCELGKQ